MRGSDEILPGIDLLQVVSGVGDGWLLGRGGSLPCEPSMNLTGRVSQLTADAPQFVLHLANRTGHILTDLAERVLDITDLSFEPLAKVERNGPHGSRPFAGLASQLWETFGAEDKESDYGDDHHLAAVDIKHPRSW